MEKNTIAWSAPEHAHEHKSPDWFWAVGIIAASIVVVSVISGNALFALFVFLGATTLFIHAVRQPREISIEIHERGISLGNLSFSYDMLDSFTVVEHNDAPCLILKSKKLFTPYSIIPLPEGYQEKVRAYLAQHLSEQTLEIRLKEVSSALERIEKGEYGKRASRETLCDRRIPQESF